MANTPGRHQSVPVLFQNVQAGLFLSIPEIPARLGLRVRLGIDARDERCHWILRKTPELNSVFQVSPVSAPELCLGLLQVQDVPSGEGYSQVAFCALVPREDPSAAWIFSMGNGVYKLTSAVQFCLRPGDVPPFHVAADGYIYPPFPQLLSMHMDFEAGMQSRSPERSLHYPIPLPGHLVCCIPLGMNALSEWRIIGAPRCGPSGQSVTSSTDVIISNE